MLSADRFLTAYPRFKGWRAEYVAIAPSIGAKIKAVLADRNVLPESLADLTSGL